MGERVVGMEVELGETGGSGGRSRSKREDEDDVESVGGEVALLVHRSVWGRTLWGKWCRVFECVVFCTLLLVIAILVLVIQQSVCWSDGDELYLLESLKSRVTLFGVPPPVPLQLAHSHNDYQQPIPVKLALSAGFCSIEADVFALEDELWTGHVAPSSNKLREQYLDILAELSQRNERGPINPISIRTGLCLQHTLLVDMKTASIDTWKLLQKQLTDVNEHYGFRIFECYNTTGGPIQEPKSPTKISPVRVVVSGVAASTAPDLVKEMKASAERCTKIDGRWEDDGTLPSDQSTREFLGMISAKWNDTFENNLSSYVEKANAAGVPIRFWDAPETVEMWKKFVSSGVHIISTDRILALQAFLLGHDV